MDLDQVTALPGGLGAVGDMVLVVAREVRVIHHLLLLVKEHRVVEEHNQDSTQVAVVEVEALLEQPELLEPAVLAVLAVQVAKAA